MAEVVTNQNETKIYRRTTQRNSTEFLPSIRRNEVVDLARKFFCLASEDYARLIYKRTPTASDLRTTQDTTKYLHDHGYLSRTVLVEPTKRVPYQKYTLVYGLSNKGVKEYGGKSYQDHKASTAMHDLKLARFHILLDQLADAHDMELDWSQDDLKHKIEPDSLFHLILPKGAFHFFVELENEKKNLMALTKKLKRYLDLFDTNECERQWNFRKFRVILIQQSNNRKPGIRRTNLLEAMAENGLVQRMFWLTTEPLYQADIGGEIFMTPKDYADQRYSFLSL